MKTYTVIPGLVSINTDLSTIPNSYLVGDLNFYSSPRREKLHYTVQKAKEIKPPASYDFRNDYFYRTGQTWTYYKKFAKTTFAFQFDAASKILTYTSPIKNLPAVIGGIQPLGSHLSDIITADLHFAGYTHLRGCAYSKGESVHAISAPGFSGKTTILTNAIGSGAKYIAEDSLIIDFKKGTIYPTNPTNLSKMFGRSTNDSLAKKLMNAKKVDKPMQLNKLILMQNATRERSITVKNLHDFVNLNGLYFNNNLFIRSMIFEKGQAKELLQDFCKYNGPIDVQFKQITNYKMDEL